MKTYHDRQFEASIPQEPIACIPFPTKTCDMNAVNFMGCLFSCLHLFCVADCYSTFLEVMVTTETMAYKVIGVSIAMLSCHFFPRTLVFDGHSLVFEAAGCWSGYW
jgi:hypothetical protein